MTFEFVFDDCNNPWAGVDFDVEQSGNNLQFMHLVISWKY